MVEFDLFEIICCPKCGGNFDKKENKLVCKGCSCEFKIKNGIPILVDPDFRL